MVISGDDLIIELLELHGTNSVFGLSGEGPSKIRDAVERFDKVQYFSAQSAQAAVLMADGYARATGDVGICHLYGGDEAVSAVPGMASAHADNIPLLLITEQTFVNDSTSGMPSDRHRAPFNHVDLQKLFDAVTKWNWRVENREEITPTIGQAFEQMESGSPGPVHLEIPSDVLESESTEFLPSRGNVSQGAPLAAYFNMLTSHLTTLVAEMMTHAKYPAIIAGGGVVSAGAGVELIQLAEILNSPVYVTPMSKGVIPSTHPLAAGLIESVVDDAEPSAVFQANAVMTIGCSLSRRTTRNGQLRLPKDLIQIDIEEKVIGRNYPVRIGMVADAKTALRQIIGIIEDEKLETHNKWKIPTAGSRAFGDRRPNQGKNQEIVEVLQSVLDKEAILAVSGEFLINLLLNHFDVSSPRTLLHSCELGVAGYAIPAAIGAKIAHRDRQIVAVTDRDEFSPMAAELITAGEKGINTSVLVIEHQHQSTQPDVIKLAESFGLSGLRIETITDLKHRLEYALKMPQISVVNLPLLV